MTDAVSSVRIDKWLWAARFFKTRGLAQTAIENGRVLVDGQRVKRARALQGGEALTVRIGDVERIVRVLALSDRRGPAPIAQALYAETPESLAKREEARQKRKVFLDPGAVIAAGRPTKRDRRQLEKTSAIGELMRQSSHRPVVLITGGSRGIGAASAALLARSGSDLVITYRNNADAAASVSKAAAADGARVVSVQADVGQEADVDQLFERIKAEFGRLDGLVNNAGVVDRAQSFLDYSCERLQRMFQTNVFGAFIVARNAARMMSTERNGGGGAIVNVSSAAARLGSANEYIDYAASKGAMDTMTLGMAKELAAHGIRVNAVRPGLIDTDIHASGGRPDRIEQFASQIPLQRGGSADEVAETIVWLLSGKASYVTGALLDVSGGR